jgi:hypothetical protein
VTETGLLIAEAAFLILLYLFVWSIVRSSSRDLRDAGPVAAPPVVTGPTHSGDTGGQPVVVRVADPPAAIPRAPAPPPPVIAGQDLAPAADVEPVESSTLRERPTGPAFELSMNIRPRLVVSSSPSLAPGGEYALEAGMTLGRSRSNGIPISDQFASHMHARVFPRGHFFYIEDLSSTNGTFVNGRRIDTQTQLKVRDEIRLGETVLRYEE